MCPKHPLVHRYSHRRMAQPSCGLVAEYVSLFGERKSAAYKLSAVEECIVVECAASSRCETGNDVEASYDRNLLFAEHVWPGSLVIADYLASNSHVVDGKSVLELGAGSALPSIVASKLHASKVVCSDYPDKAILDNIQELSDRNECKQLEVMPYKWGDDASLLLNCLSSLPESNERFDVVILAECLWKDTYPLHESLLNSIQQCIFSSSCERKTTVLVSFAHRPSLDHTPAHDLEFLERAQRELGLTSTLVLQTDRYSDAMDGEPITEYLYLLSF